MILRLMLGFFWWLLHFAVDFVSLWSCLVQLIYSCIVSSGLLRRYRNLYSNNLRYMAIVFDNEDAKNTKKIKQLLCWLSSINVNYVTLYDMEGVLKKTIEADVNGLVDCSENTFTVGKVNHAATFVHAENMTIEVLSYSDNREGTAKAASFLFSNFLKDRSLSCQKKERVLTESEVSSALKAVGYGGPEADLLLAYGPARCHLGFPAWRLRYTEIVHMGSINYMSYGSLLKTIYDFSRKHQNYGK